MQKIQWKGGDDQVSAMCLGTMYFGSRVDKPTSYRILDAYFDQGGNFLDTADCYVFWIEGFTEDASETLLGEYLADRGNRHDTFLATKLGARSVNRNDGTQPVARAPGSTIADATCSSGASGASSSTFISTPSRADRTVAARSCPLRRAAG